MRLPYRITEAANRLYKAGIAYHAYGIIKQNGKLMFEYYKCDKVTNDQIETIKQYCPDLKIGRSCWEYAPELTRVVLMFPKSAYYRDM